MVQSLRGMNDLFWPENEKFLYFIQHASRIAQQYGYEFIQTPILEETALFKRSVGESSDIVGKEMYQFIDKGQNDVCMRPEGTAGVVRSFIQKKLDRAGGKHKFFYYGPMFRYERPQKGRLRSFHQFGCESFGEASVYEDATVIMMIKEILDFFCVGYSLKINSLGCPTCMPSYREKLVAFLTEKEANLCEDCHRRISTNPIRVLDCKNNQCQVEYVHAPKLLNNLCVSCDDDFITLQRLLDQAGVSYEIDTNLVRGLDYYSKSAFEFVSNNLGAQNAVAGGGRYDRLVEFLEGKSTPAVGFAIGIERIMDLIEVPQKTYEGYYFGAMVEEAVDMLFVLTAKARKKYKAVFEYQPKSLKAHLKAADKIGAKYCVVVGEDEIKNAKLWVKDLENKEEKLLLISELFDEHRGETVQE